MSTLDKPADHPRNETVIVFALSLAAMVVAMMQTLVVPILTLIQTSLGTTTANASWVTTATLLSAAVFTPLLGRFGDQHGKKPTLVAVLVVMVAGSVLAATTHSLLWLIVGRVLQGAATAIFPLALSVLREEIRPAKLPGAMALVSGTLAFGSGLALVAVGLLTAGDNPDYRSAFWMATILAVLALLAVVFLVPATRQKSGGRTDILGALSLAATLVLLLLPITQGHEWGWSSTRTVGSFAGAVVMAAVWVLVERRVREPLVDMSMFVHRPVLFANAAGLLVGFGSFTSFIGISYLVQMPSAITGYGFDASILRASVEYLLPSAMMSLLAAPMRRSAGPPPRPARRAGARLGVRCGRLRVDRRRSFAHGVGDRRGDAHRRGDQLRLRGHAGRDHGERAAPPERHRQRHQLHLPLHRQRDRHGGHHHGPGLQERGERACGVRGAARRVAVHAELRHRGRGARARGAGRLARPADSRPYGGGTGFGGRGCYEGRVRDRVRVRQRLRKVT